MTPTSPARALLRTAVGAVRSTVQVLPRRPCAPPSLSRRSLSLVVGPLCLVLCERRQLCQKVPDGYYLTFGDSEKLMISDWWGREREFLSIVARDPVPSVKMDFGDWMT